MTPVWKAHSWDRQTVWGCLACWYPHGFFMNHSSSKKKKIRPQNFFSPWGPFYEVVGTHSNLTMRQTVTQFGNNRGFCAFKSHFQSNTRTRSGFLCTMDWIFCHYNGLISKIGPGVGMFYVEKGTGRGAVGEAAGRLGRAEADRRASVCMHACGCLCVCACTHVGACVCWSVWSHSWDGV